MIWTSLSLAPGTTLAIISVNIIIVNIIIVNIVITNIIANIIH